MAVCGRAFLAERGEDSRDRYNKVGLSPLAKPDAALAEACRASPSRLRAFGAREGSAPTYKSPLAGCLTGISAPFEVTSFYRTLNAYVLLLLRTGGFFGVGVRGVANTVRNGVNSSLGTSLTDAADDATLLVTSDGFFSTASNAVQLTGLNSKATIGGLVESTGAGFAFTGGPGCYLTVLSTGTISGATAVKLSGNGNIANHGHILGAIGFDASFPLLKIPG